MNAQDFAKAIKNRQTVFGTCIVMPSIRTVGFTDSLGTDFLFIDTEHTPQDREQVAWMCQAFNAKGQAPLVRVPSADEIEVTKMIDAGAMAVLIPYVETVEQVKRLGGALRYRPLKGKKLADVLDGSVELTQKEKDYLANYNKNRLLFINIESIEGIKNLDNMLKTGYVDAVVIGPHDLSVNLGIPEEYDNEIFENAVRDIIRICVENKVSVGNHYSYGEDRQVEWAKLGMNIILNSSDVRSFVAKTKEDMSYLRTKILCS